MRHTLTVTCFALCVLFIVTGAVAARPLDPDLLAGLSARSIGPAGMSGRVADIDAVESDPSIVYVGTAAGGVWKSVDGAVSFTPIFDKEKVASIGDVTIFQQNPDIVWVGTGEGNPRNSVSVGWGVYRSLDAGRTWTHLGLEKTEHIHRIVLHPNDPNVAWVAALGQTWGENPERGVFKTVDGGKTWQKVLFVDARTGCAELVIDPSDPNRLLAAMWDHRRWPWSFRSGGPGSGLYLTNDGGTTWKRLTEDDGLPKGELGRMGLSFCRRHPEVVYALVEAKVSALLRSEDGGRTWKKVNDDQRVANRPFYYADIRVDPELPNRVYNLTSRLQVSDDGGKSFASLGNQRTIHPDFHALWISPTDPSHMIVGDDGGIAESRDRGRSWRFVGNLPIGQFYHVSVDMDTPYHVYGGLQDNGSWRGPSTVWENGGIRNQHWQEVGFGDGFDVSPDPKDSLQGYAMSQEGNLLRYDLRTGERKTIRPAPSVGMKLRFNWNAAFAQDPFDPATIYYGSQFVHRSTDRGESWTAISPDLTSNNPEWQKQAESGGLTPESTGAENFTTIIAIAPSPVKRGVIWAGSDDGRLHVTRDAGATWQTVEGNVKGIPPNTWIPRIEPSKFDAATAFVVFDDHRRSNWTPYVYKTADYGKTWTSLASKELWGYCLVIEQDLVDPGLLFLGTEFGLWISQDGGASWWRFTQGLPTTSVMDLAIHPREHDLVIATHGRSLYVIDDIRPLRSLTPQAFTASLTLFPTADAQQYRIRQTDGERFPGDAEFRGTNRPYGALIAFSLNVPGLPLPDPEKERARKASAPAPTSERPAPAGESETAESERPDRGPQVTITVADSGGKVIRTFRSKATQGVNRAVWNLRRDAFKEAPREEERFFDEGGGPEVLPGVYTLTVKYKENVAKGNVKVVADPRFAISDADRKAKWDALMRAGALQERATEAITRLTEAQADVDVIVRKLRAAGRDRVEAEGEGERGPNAALLRSARALKSALTEAEKTLRVPPKTKGMDRSEVATGKISYILGSLGSSWDAPTPPQLAYLAEAEGVLAKALTAVDTVFAKDVAAFRAEVGKAGITLLPEKPPLATK